MNARRISPAVPLYSFTCPKLSESCIWHELENCYAIEKFGNIATVTSTCTRHLSYDNSVFSMHTVLSVCDYATDTVVSVLGNSSYSTWSSVRKCCVMGNLSCCSMQTWFEDLF